MGGWSYYDARKKEFDFDSMVPENIKKKDILWLDENKTLKR